MSRLLALDYGDKTIGIAVSDPTGRIALGLETLRRTDEKSLKASLRRLGELIALYEVKTIVLGFPKNMDNSQGRRCEKTLAFKTKLERNFKIPTVLWDERLSTAGAWRTLSHPEKIDETAAVLILQGYIEKESRRTMTEFEFEEEGFDVGESAITMFDEDGNETCYQLLSTQKDGESLFILTEEQLDNSENDDEQIAEVLIFKCVEDYSAEDEDMVFELVDEDHEDFEKALALFKDDFKAFGIEY
jgi:putative Holliday junction resolvase